MRPGQLVTWPVGAVARLLGHRVFRYVGLTMAVSAAILAVAVVSTLTIDLGPRLKGLAEREGSRRISRDVRIGRLGLHVARGRVVIEDLSIDGRRPGDKPFFTAGRLSLSLDWSTALRRRPEFNVTSVELTDWHMLVEQWPDGHSFPRLIRRDASQPAGPRRFTTTVQYLRAWRGQFTFVDHGAPWGIVAPNIDLFIVNEPNYHGEAVFSGGTISIEDYVPMWANMKARFTIDGSRLQLDRVEIDTDGAVTVARGEVNLNRWPDQTHTVQSRVNFQRMRELFFARQDWQLSGEGDFKGTFRLFRGGHDLAGDFLSDAAGVDGYRFPSLYGSLHWTRNGFAVTDAGSDVYGGAARFGFSIAPLGSREPAVARFDVDYTDVDVAELSDVHELPGLRMAGRVSGRHAVEWPIARFADNRGDGVVRITPPTGVVPMTASLEGARAADPDHTRHAWGPFAPPPLPAHLPIAGELSYRFDPGQVAVGPGVFATESTHVTFDGVSRWGDESDVRFKVTSRDWQESDQVLAGILTNLGSPTRAVTFGGRGEFEGAMTGDLRRPRVAGMFRGEDLRAWDTMWGEGTAQVVIENQYVTINRGVVRLDGSEILAEGRFSLGYPRRDQGDEIDATFRVTRRDLQSVRHAFALDDYPVTGWLSGVFTLTGAYERPIGFGAMTIEGGVAYGEPFEKGTASVRLDGSGVRLDGIQIATAGLVTGAAFIGWDSTYAFDMDGRGFPVDRLAAFAFPRAQPTGVLEFAATGRGTFDEPRNDVRFQIEDLFVADEGVGEVSGTLVLRGTELTGEVSVASPRLAMTGTGRIALTAGQEAELTFRFHDTSLDPYVRLFVPRLSPFTTAVATGTVRVTGALSAFDRVVVEATVDSLDMRLFDYGVGIARPIRLALAQEVVRVEDLQLVGEDTQLAIGGAIDLADERIALKAEGDANLGILQGFFRNVRGSGHAQLSAAIDGPLRAPVLLGRATITDGRVRHFSLPNSLDGINGSVEFDSRGIGLDDLTAVMGGGRVQFGGRIGLEGYQPGELSVTARGEGMQLRYPAGVRSVVDADLAVRGSFVAPTLGGLVTVRSATWTERFDPTGGFFDFGGEEEGTAPAPASSAVPLRFDLSIVVPSTLRIENNLARLVASADLQLRGTYDRPVLFGRAEVDRGEIVFEGRRYLVTRGAIDFNNPSRIEPFFDVEAETRVRVPGQTYRVIVSAAGTMARMQPQLSSDPPLPAPDVLALLFSDVRRSADAELRALQNPNEVQTDILAARATQLLAAPISSEVGRVVEQTFGVDTFQLTPSLIDPYSYSTSPRVNPSARVTIGKRISDRVYLTFSRSLSSSLNDQILLLEYDESDRFSWILSRNEDQTYAVEVRVRHAF
jgi:hypothetical protein